MNAISFTLLPPAAPPPRWIALGIRIGGRQLWRGRAGLRVIDCSLTDAAVGRVPALAEPGTDGFFVRSLRADRIAELRRQVPDWHVVVRHRYPRHFVPMAGRSFDDWHGGFSARTRSTLARKARRLAAAFPGGFEVREYRTPAEMRRFMALAAPLSERTYQQRLYGAGLPAKPHDIERIVGEAMRDDVRAFLLFAGDRAIAYLYLPIEDDVLIYANLGYDPDYERLSPGTVLHMEAMRRLFAEKRFRLFDFTSGDGAHKAAFGRGAIDCVDVALLRPGVRRQMLGAALAGVDRLLALGKAVFARGLGWRPRRR